MTIPFLNMVAMQAEVRAELDEAWRQVTRSGQFIGGVFVERFEAEWAAYCGTRHCVAVSDGTAALQLSLAGLGIGSGDEVILPANTFIATAEAVAAVGAFPVFIDVDPETHLMTAEGVAAAIGPRTAAVIAVHLFGQPVDMDAINRLASAAGIAVLEDAAQAHGATWCGRRAGSLSRAGCFSFYPGKNLGALGDAGAVVTDDPALAERVRCLGNHGRVRNAPCRHEFKGGNYRLDGLQAAVLSVKLGRLDEWNRSRQRAAEHYRTALGELAIERVPVEMVEVAAGACSSHHLLVVRTPERDRLQRDLAAEGIGTGIHYPVPCHRQPAFTAKRIPRLPIVEAAAETILSLPMGPHLTKAEIARVVAGIGRSLTVRHPARLGPCVARAAG